MKIFIILLFCIILLIVSPFTIFAQSQTDQSNNKFSTNYNISYDVDEQSVTTVSQNIKLKNLTDKYFASTFTLTIGSTQLFDIEASDSSGTLPVKSKTDLNSTIIDVTFNQQLAGKDKEYNWTLKFKSKDFAQKIGKTTQIAIPKFTATAKEDYSIKLAVPVSFGDPTLINPKPSTESENGGKLIYQFNSKQLTDSGILVNFGTEQKLKFVLNYQLQNRSFFPKIEKVAIPADIKPQKVIISKISPIPEDVTLDKDGNFIAWFKLDNNTNMDVLIEGLANVSYDQNFTSDNLQSTQTSLLTQSQKYWESDNPLIKSKVVEILKNSLSDNPKERMSNSQKAKIINQFVVNYLKYNPSKDQPLQRLGALTSLTNPDKSSSFEFNDLFVALARAENIPARVLVGFSLISNRTIKPVSALSSIHVWSQFYDQELGWVNVDPVWQNTSGGVNYFANIDLNYLSLFNIGYLSQAFTLPKSVQFNLSEEDFKPSASLKISVNSQDQIFSGIPAKVKIQIINQGNTFLPPNQLKISTLKIEKTLPETILMTGIPPFGKLEYDFQLKGRNIFENYQEELTVSVGNQTVKKNIEVKPFLASKLFMLGVLGAFSLMVVLYIAIFIYHLFSFKSQKTTSQKEIKNQAIKLPKKVVKTNKKFKKKSKSKQTLVTR